VVRIPAYLAQGPEFKLQYLKKRKKETKNMFFFA
jgi:hypothetical protein